MIKVNDKIFRWLIIIVPFLFGLFAENLSEKPFDSTWVPRIILSLITIITICEGNRFIIYRTRPYFKSYKPSTRLLIVIFAGLTFTSMIIAGNMLMENFITKREWVGKIYNNASFTFNNSKIHTGLITIAFFKAIGLFFPLLLSNEGIYHFAKLRHIEKAKEQLEKGKLQAELQQLKGIINPHFIFNNLNSLSSLIGEDPVQAEVFLDEFTRVFRYLLRNNENELTTLKQEIEFIRSYYHLLQTRYGAGINITLMLEKEHDDLLLPPLTLQLLVENAVKHNRTGRENPLQIELITMPGNRLMVRNNIIKKEGKVESTGIGLQSINARYRMLNRPGVIIENDDVYFSVTILMIND